MFMLGNTLPMTSHLVFQLPESSQFTQETKITNFLGHTLYTLAQIPIETLQPSALKTARMAQQLSEVFLGIYQIFEPSHIRHGQGLATRWIPRGNPQGGFVNQQPRFLHSHRNDTNDRQGPSSIAPFQRHADFFPALLHRFALGVPMHEEQIAGIQLHALVDAPGQFSGRFREPSQIGKFRLDGNIIPVLTQQPSENGYERPIGRTVTHQRIAQPLHSAPDS